MSIHNVTREECITEGVNIQLAYQFFMSELEYINTERGLLLQEATRMLEEAAAEKLRRRIHEQFHHGN